MLLAQRIVFDITTGHVQVGDQLASERDMLAEYQVGRGTLRESLRYLEMQGVIRMRLGPSGGPVVTAPTYRNLASTISLLLHRSGSRFRDVLEAREIFEPAMAARAAAHIECDALVALGDSIEMMRARIDDVDAFLEENRRFHDAIAWSSGNDLFGLLVESLHGITDGSALGVEYPIAHREHVMHAHERIYDAIVAKDPAAAAAAMLDHISEFSRYMDRRYPQLMERVPDWDVEAGE
jgi:DNA-binding FadR family transcriptional regulator